MAKLQIYTKANGLLNDQFNYNSGYKDNEGKLYFGSVQGVIVFNPADFSKSKSTSPIYITSIQVKNKELEVNRDTEFLKKSVLYTDNITLPYNQSSFSFDFATLNFTSAATTEYSYKMDGLDKEWNYIKSNRKVYYTNVEPGTYTFKVKAGNNGIWNRQLTQLRVTITPPFWATFSAYSLYIILCIALLYYLVRTYHKIQLNKKEKEIYEAKIEFFMCMAHEIKTPLTLIKGPVENLKDMVNELPEIKEDLVTMERNTNRLVNLINQILDFHHIETKGFSLEYSKVILNEILEEAYAAFDPLAKKRKLTYTIKLPSNSINTIADAEALHKILDNLFSNAVKYAHNVVTIQLLTPKKDERKFIIEITNDGFIIPKEMKEKIFEPFFRMQETINQKGTGLGLTLARSLAKLHNGQLYLKDSDGEFNVFVLVSCQLSIVV